MPRIKCWYPGVFVSVSYDGTIFAQWANLVFAYVGRHRATLVGEHEVRPSTRMISWIAYRSVV